MIDTGKQRASLVQTRPADWVSDEAVSDCQSCARPFTITNRKHHCRSCGRVICSTCSPHSLQLPSQTKAVRVCQSCFTANRIETRGIFHADLMAAVKAQCDPENATIVRKAELLQSMRTIEASISSASLTFDIDVDDATRERRALEFNQLGQRAALILDELTSLRLKGGLFRCILINKEYPDVRPSIIRTCLITPFAANNQSDARLPALIVLSSLIHQASNVNTIPSADNQSTPQLRWHSVRLMDDLASAKLIDFQIGTVNHHAIQLSFKQGDPLVLVFIDESGRTALDSIFWQLFSLPDQPPIKTSLATREIEGNFEWRSDIEMNMILHTQLKQRTEAERTQLKAASQLESWAHESVNWDNEEHEKLLRRLYETFSPEPAPFVGRKHDKWKVIGFQSEDPCTDFRGMGRLALECLVFAGDNAPNTIRELVTAQPDRCYPLCATQINIVSACAEALGLSRVRPTNAASVNATRLYRVFARSSRATLSGTSEQVPVEKHFHMLVLALMSWLDAEAVQTKADYMSMGTVLKSMKETLNDAINRDPATVDALIEILHQNHAKPHPSEAQSPVSVTEAKEVISDTESEASQSANNDEKDQETQQ